MNLKPGTKVRVKKDLKANQQCGNDVFIGSMAEWKGEIVTIKNHNPNTGKYEIKETGYNWTLEMFDLDFVSDPGLSDLITGLAVYKELIIKDPKLGKQLLINAGILTKKGKLSKNYKYLSL